MKQNTEKLRKKYIDDPPEGMTSGDIRPMSDMPPTHPLRSLFFQTALRQILSFIDLGKVLTEDIMGQLRTYGFDARFRLESGIVLRRVDHQMYMGMMPLIMEIRIPSQIRAINLHVPGEHGTFGAKERHPLSGGVISEPCRICKQAMLTDPFHTGTVGQVVHIVFFEVL